jgi:hypothetical protein
VLDAYRLNEVHGHKPGVLLPHHPSARKLIAPAFKTADPIAEVAAIRPPEFEYRLLLQRSVFTVHGDNTPLESHPRHSEFLGKMVIPAARRSGIRAQLEALGINRAYLFPDLQNLAAYLNEGSGGAS